MSDDPVAACPECGKPGERLLSGGAGFLFKGDGFYITDYRSDSYKKRAASDGGSGSKDSAGGDGSDGKTSPSDGGSSGNGSSGDAKSSSDSKTSEKSAPAKAKD